MQLGRCLEKGLTRNDSLGRVFQCIYIPQCIRKTGAAGEDEMTIPILHPAVAVCSARDQERKFSRACFNSTVTLRGNPDPVKRRTVYKRFGGILDNKICFSG